MKRRNQVLDKISSLEEEVGRLRERIPEDTNPQYDLWIRICNSILTKIEDLQNIVELEEDGIQ
jgi:hypothetical protein|tara:strand:+ start:592 stop:780 length:189 start_codon:yes stop_codon:yes gene_type:complete